MSVKFIKGVDEIEIKGYEFPFIDEYDPGQVVAESEGGTVFVQTKAAERSVQSFTWKDLSTTEKDNLKGFLKDKARGSRNTWTFQDVDTTQKTARWLDPPFRPTCDRENRWRVSLLLEFS